jgi:hypothetical protein
MDVELWTPHFKPENGEGRASTWDDHYQRILQYNHATSTWKLGYFAALAQPDPTPQPFHIWQPDFATLCFSTSCCCLHSTSQTHGVTSVFSLPGALGAPQ